MHEYRTFTASEYAALPEDRTPWIIRDMLPAGGSALIYGPAKAKKSFAAQEMAYAIADPRHTDWFSFPVESHGKVLYLQLDTARSIWQERIQRYRDHGLETPDLHIADKQSSPFPFEILNPSHYNWLRDQCQRIQPIAVFIDVLRKATLADENNSTEIIKVCNAFEGAVAPAALIIISHAKKPQPDAGGGDDHAHGQDMRGSGALIGNVDSIIRMTKKTFSFSGRTTEDGKLKLLWDKHTYRFTVDASEFNTHLEAVLNDPSLRSTHAKAIRLSDLSKRSFGACRSALRRKLGKIE